jgi:hypothetical protein
MEELRPHRLFQILDAEAGCSQRQEGFLRPARQAARLGHLDKESQVDEVKMRNVGDNGVHDQVNSAAFSHSATGRAPAFVFDEVHLRLR